MAAGRVGCTARPWGAVSARRARSSSTTALASSPASATSRLTTNSSKVPSSARNSSSSSGRESAVCVSVTAERSVSGASSLTTHAANASRQARSASVRPPGRSIVMVADEVDVLPGNARSRASLASRDGELAGRNEVWSVDPWPDRLGAVTAKKAAATIHTARIRNRKRKVQEPRRSNIKVPPRVGRGARTRC